jgi:hypothetical protein
MRGGQLGLQDYKIPGLQKDNRITGWITRLQLDYRMPGLQLDYSITEKLQKNYRKITE